jgi:hypothetical protein
LPVEWLPRAAALAAIERVEQAAVHAAAARSRRRAHSA